VAEPLKGEPVFALPVKQATGLFVLMLILSMVTKHLPWSDWGASAGFADGIHWSTGAMTCFLAAIFYALGPWKRRPASEWMLWWLGSTVVRVLGAPLVLISIYFLSLLPAMSVLVGGVVWTVLGLLAEAVIVAKSVSRQSASTTDRSK
jgi:hypothetical protein